MFVAPLPVQVAMALMRLNALPSQTAQISVFLVESHVYEQFPIEKSSTWGR